MPADAGLDIDFDHLPPAPANGASPADDRALASIQAAAAGLPPDEPAVLDGEAVPAQTVPFMGRRFKIADKIGLMPLLKFSAFADMEIQDPRALGAMYAMLRDCIDASDWRAFEDHATDSKAGADELMDVVTKTLELITGRPPVPPSPSSAGRRGIAGGSTAGSSSRRGKGSRR